jgi:peptide/nickel transport system permease protein
VTAAAAYERLEPAASAAPGRDGWLRASRSRRVMFGGGVLAAIAIAAIAAPLLGAVDPVAINPLSRNLPPGAAATLTRLDGSTAERVALFGTDGLGRDVYSRVLYGGRISLFVGVAAALLSGAIGMGVGLAAGYVRALDAVVMRAMDGLMAIPGVLLAIGLVSVWRAGVLTVVAAIVIPETPRVVRLVRAVTLKVREEPYIEAAVGVGSSPGAILARHVAPSVVAPLIVQCTFACATAILIEAALSFLAVGVPIETPTWGNVMAEGRQWFRLYPQTILAPGLFVALTVLSVNMLGDGLRDAFDASERPS